MNTDGGCARHGPTKNFEVFVDVEIKKGEKNYDKYLDTKRPKVVQTNDIVG